MTQICGLPLSLVRNVPSMQAPGLRDALLWKSHANHAAAAGMTSRTTAEENHWRKGMQSFCGDSNGNDNAPP